MSSTKDQEMFVAVGRAFPALRERLCEMLAAQQLVLEQHADETTLRRAQGQATCLRGLIRALDPSASARKGST